MYLKNKISRLFKHSGIVLVVFVLISNSVAFAANIKMPTASGEKVVKNDKAVIDVSNVSQGYVMVKYTGNSNGTIKLTIKKTDGSTYTYNVFKKNEYEVFPFTEGDGTYKITVYEGIGGTKYVTANGTSVKVNIKDELLPFLHPNQYVWFDKNSPIVSLAQKVVGNETDSMKKVKVIYEYVINNVAYDYEKAKVVKSGYVCDIDATLKSKKGICLDYAAVMAAMLRSQNIPTKLVVGYAGTQYHAWISIYSKEEGWIENVIYFDGKSWTMMDPTMASTSKKADFKMDEKKYSAKYAY